MFQEYPKGLFRGGVPEAECRIALHKHDEDALRSEGFVSIGESKEKPPEPIKRKGRPPKAKE